MLNEFEADMLKRYEKRLAKKKAFYNTFVRSSYEGAQEAVLAVAREISDLETIISLLKDLERKQKQGFLWRLKRIIKSGGHQK